MEAEPGGLVDAILRVEARTGNAGYRRTSGLRLTTASATEDVDTSAATTLPVSFSLADSDRSSKPSGR
jgi:hypothetical protein